MIHHSYPSSSNLLSNATALSGSDAYEITIIGWMYHHGFEDINGHIWEIVYMDESSKPK